MLKNKLQIFTTIVFLGFIGWWISFQHVVAKQGPSVNWFENTYGVIALFGSIFGIVAARKWGGWRSVLGKSLIYLSLGLFAQEAGQLISSYYTQVLKVNLPYPSWGDLAYFGSVVLYVIAVFYLAKAIGTKFSLKKLSYQAVAILLPLIVLLVSYRLLLFHHHYDTKHPLTVFLDIGYPFGEALYISIAIVAYLLSRKLLGGILKPAILVVIFALIVQYAADFTFILQSNKNSYVPGKYDDLLYLVAYYILTLATIMFIHEFKQLKNRTTSAALDKSKNSEKA